MLGSTTMRRGAAAVRVLAKPHPPATLPRVLFKDERLPVENHIVERVNLNVTVIDRANDRKYCRYLCPLHQMTRITGKMLKNRAIDHEVYMIKKNEDKIKALESNEWLEERRARHTVSNFGLVCRRKSHARCTPEVKQLLYTNVDCASTKHGQKYEPRAIVDLEKIAVLKIENDSPDGLVGDEGAVEVKCPASASHL
ncbi:hypothetical protein J6590_020678 [Homalodisca vitripennis]|nr:hypothetical protein J6590_020678 [Homalodisca vitripennis]